MSDPGPLHRAPTDSAIDAMAACRGGGFPDALRVRFRWGFHMHLPFVSSLRVARVSASLSFAVVCAVAGPAHAGGIEQSWPGAAPCNTSLQACIDASVAGAHIVIVQTTPIDETLNIQNRSLTLRAADGQRARFAPGRDLFVGVAPISADVDVTLQGLDFLDGTVSVSFNNAGTGRFTLRDLTLAGEDALGGKMIVRAVDGNVDTLIENNRITGSPGSAANALLEVESDGAVLDARIHHNTVQRSDLTGDGSGIRVRALEGATGTAKLHANVVRGGFVNGSILMQEWPFSETPSDYAVRLFNNVVVGVLQEDFIGDPTRGIVLGAQHGRLHGVVLNNTVTAVAYGIDAMHWLPEGVTGRIDGIIANNLVVAYRGLALSTELAAVPSNHHNLINATVNEATLGPNTITAPAQLQSRGRPRLRAGSPAIDAADTAALGLGLILNGLPTNDADGLRRIKGAVPDAADIGAYEFGDIAFSARTRPVTTDHHVGVIAHPALDGTPPAHLLLTPDASGGTPLLHAFGVFYRSLSSQWAAFLQNTALPMPARTRFAAFVPAAGSGVFRHEATAGNTSGKFTRLDNSALDGLDDRIVLVTQNWSVANTYNNHPIGLLSNGSNWFIDNMDDAAMPIGAGFNVYVQAPSPNAFRVRAPVGETQLRLRHPLLDGNACARPQVTRQYNSIHTDNHFQLLFEDGAWVIDNGGVAFAGVTQFHVVVVPEQTETCEGLLFDDGFESSSPID